MSIATEQKIAEINDKLEKMDKELERLYMLIKLLQEVKKPGRPKRVDD